MDIVTIIGIILGIYLAVAHGRRSDARKAARYAEVREHHAKAGDWAVQTNVGLYVLPPFHKIPAHILADAQHGRTAPLLDWLTDTGYPELAIKAQGTTLGFSNHRQLGHILCAWRDHEDTP